MTASGQAVDWIGLTGAAGTAALHLFMQAEGPNPAFIVGACLFWAAYVAVRAWQDRDAFRRWGFRADNLGGATVIPALVLAVTLAVFASYAAVHHTLRF